MEVENTVQFQNIDRTSIPWPEWVLRSISTGTTEALHDAIWSVGGSPPYGDVSYEEAAAVYELLEQFSGPGMASEEVYNGVRRLIADDTERLDVLEIFRISDRISSNPEVFTVEDAALGLSLARKIEHIGAQAYFNSLLAEFDHRNGNIPAARARILEVLPVFSVLAAQDNAYIDRMLATLQNTISFCAMDGYFDTARMMLSQFGSLLDNSTRQNFSMLLGDKPVFSSNVSQLSDRASEFLEKGDYSKALEWYSEAERVARDIGMEAELSGLLGDKAFAFNRLGNIKRAIETYEEAIAFSKSFQDWVNLSRWSQNLGIIYMRRDNLDEARAHFKAALDASVKSRVPYQISTAVGNYAAFLTEVERYEEAVQVLDRALEAAPDEHELYEVWQGMKFVVYSGWGKRLQEEGQIANAIKAYTAALQHTDFEDNQHLQRAAILAATLAALYEQQNDIPQALAAIDEAITLFQMLGDTERIANLERVRGQLSKQRLKLSEAGEFPGNIAELRQAVAEAIAEGDYHNEATARVNLAVLLSKSEDPTTVGFFDESMALIRRRQDHRRELILDLNFIPYFLARKQVPRALSLAERAVELVGNQQIEHQILANLYLGQVQSEGLGEDALAMKPYKDGISAMRQYLQSDPKAAKVLIERFTLLIASAAQTALRIGEIDEAAEIMSLIDPDMRQVLEERGQPVYQDEALIDLDSLKEMSYPALDPILAAWRSTANAEHLGTIEDNDPRLERLAGIAEVFDWPDAVTRFNAATIAVQSEGETQNGPGGFIHLARMMAERKISVDTALDTLGSLALSDDDLAVISLYALIDEYLSTTGGTINLWSLGIEYASDPVLVGRLVRMAGMYTRDLDEQLRLYRLGTSRLAGGEDDRLRALLLIEEAVVLNNLQRFEMGADVANEAKALAESVGAMKLAAMASGNFGISLMNMKRFEEAVPMFESIAEFQQSIGDEVSLEATIHNLNVCYIKLGRDDLVVTDEDSTDPDVLGLQAQYLGSKGSYERAIAKFTRVFELIEEMDTPYRHEAGLRNNFARTLYDAGRLEEAIEQMKLSAELYEAQNHLEGVQEATSWLTGVSLRNPSVRRYYAERDLDLARQLDDPKKLAISLGHLGQILSDEGEHEQAIALLGEAVKLDNRSDLQLSLTTALINGGRANDALKVFEELQSQDFPVNDLEMQIRLMLGQAEAHQALQQDYEALKLLHHAYSLAQPVSNETGLQAANRFALALLNVNELIEAAQVLEAGIDQARHQNKPESELSMLANLGSVLKEMGYLEDAEETLLLVRKRRRDRGEAKEEGIALFHLGNVAHTRGNHQQALDYYQEATHIAQRAGNDDLEAVSVDSIANMYTFLGKPERAIEYHRRAAALHERQGNWEDKAADLLNLSQSLMAVQELEEAKGAFEEASGLVARYDINNLAWNVAFGAGRTAALENDWDTARSSFQESISELEKIRSAFDTPGQQRQWVTDKTTVYSVAAQEALKAGDGQAALEFIEANKARYLRSLIQGRTQRPEGVDENAWLRYQKAASDRSQLQVQRWATLAHSQTDYNQTLKEATAVYEAARAAIGKIGLDPSVSQADSELSTWLEMVQFIPEDCIAVSLSAYSIGLGVVTSGRDKQGKPWARAVFSDKFTSVDLNRLIYGDQESLRQAIEGKQLDQFPAENVGWLLGSTSFGQGEAWLDTMARVDGPEILAANQLWPDTITDVCKVIGQKIWPAIIKALPSGARKLILIPSASLAIFPLHGAILANGDHVDRRFDISYVPSLAILKRIQHVDVKSHQISLTQAVNPTRDLPFSETESKRVAMCFPASQVTTLKGHEATVDSVLSLIRAGDVFHFSGHAFYDHQEPFLSGLVCISQEGENQILTLGMILDQLASIDNKLIVLSACETGVVGADDYLDDFLGLPGGLIVAGGRAILSSLWRVEDLSTSLLLEEFFNNWDHTKRNGSQALASAQNWLRTVTAAKLAKRFDIERKKPMSEQLYSYDQASDAWQRFAYEYESEDLPFSNPFYWAPFTYTGI